MLTVFCRTRFVGYHRWKTAPEEVAFLRDWHRHEFHVEAEVIVGHENRDVEFTLLKKEVEQFVRVNYREAKFEYSCETLAKEIAFNLQQKGFTVKKVEVSEDGENGGRFYAC